ncbi:MAG TPA: hypothetical protein VLT82_21785 [Myxococcaceae bacterium]|nr:hypothetical protein [Myxococcaceae bacterium]
MGCADLARFGRFLLAGLLVAAPGCVHGLRTLPRTEAVHQYVYAHSVDETLGVAATLLEQRGYVVYREEFSLGTDFVKNEKEQTVGVRVDAEEVDGSHWRIRAERFVLTAAGFWAPSNLRDEETYVVTERLYRTATRDTALARKDIITPGRADEEKATTLTAPPEGMVIGQRVRDDALEWELLTRIDQPAAAAIELEDQRSRGVASPPTPPPQAVVDAAGPCGERVDGVEELAASRRLVLLGDFPGTREIPDLVGRLACQAALAGVPVVIGLELVRADQPALEAFLSSDSDLDEMAFLRSSPSFRRTWQDGRTSEAVLELIARLRVLRHAGLPVSAFAIDDKGVAFNSRNLAMARYIEDARRATPEALMLVMVGNVRARVQLLPDAPDYWPVGWQLIRWGLRPVALRVRFEDGTAWYCTPDPLPNCGVRPVKAPQHVVSVTTLLRDETRNTNLSPQDQQPTGQLFPGTLRIWGDDPQGGFHGEFAVGPLTASPPARLR